MSYAKSDKNIIIHRYGTKLIFHITFINYFLVSIEIHLMMNKFILIDFIFLFNLFSFKFPNKRN